MLILGMTATALAISDGTYDYNGTFYFDARTADGSDTSTAEQFGKECPLTGSFCMTDLVVSGGGTTIQGPAEEPYGIAVEELLIKPPLLVIRLQGAGQINLTVGDTGNDLTTTIDVGEMEAGCGTAPCLNDWSTEEATASGTPADVVAGEIPHRDPIRPDGEDGCTGGTVPYAMVEFTTETVTAEVENEIGGGSHSYSNTMAGGLDALNLRISAADTIMRTIVGGQELQGDQMIILTFDGTFCDFSGGSCAQNCPE